MIEANAYVFAQLLERAKLSGRDFADAGKARWVKTEPAEKEWLKNAKIISTALIPYKVVAATLVHEDKFYLCTTGLPQLSANDVVLTPVLLNAGLLTALLYELNLPPKASASPLEIVDEIIAAHKDVDGYDGHDPFLVSKFFPNIAVYEIDPNSPIKPQETFRLGCYCAIKSRHGAMLPFSQVTLELIEQMVANGPISTPFENLINSFQSAHWQHSFLEAYRCLERVFAFQIIEDLHRELSIASSLLTFTSKIEKTTGWRPKEDEAIARLFAAAPADVVLPIDKVKNQLPTQQEQKVANWFYNLRNSVVHFRPATDQFTLSDAQWDDIVQSCIRLIGNLYQKYSGHLTAA